MLYFFYLSGYVLGQGIVDAVHLGFRCIAWGLELRASDLELQNNNYFSFRMRVAVLNAILS